MGRQGAATRDSGADLRGHTRLRLGALERTRVVYAPHEGATLLSLVADALGGRAHQVPERWRRAVRSAAPASAPAVLRPLFAPSYSVIPDCITPTASMPHGDVRAQCEYVADLCPDTLLAELEREFGAVVPPQWQPVVDRPRPWLRAYAAVLDAVWREFAPVWRDVDTLMQREAERVGSAVVRGLTAELLSGVSPRFRLVGDTLHLPDPQSTVYELGDRTLVLVPVASGMGASLFALDLPDLVWLGYPVPGLGRLWDRQPAQPPPPTDSLSQVVGPLRAMILREIHSPLSMGELATRLGCSPANATYHCRQLADAGLLERHPRGRTVILKRTLRGDGLVDLLS